MELAKSLRSVTLDEADSQGLIDSLDGTIAWAEREDPAPATRDRLWKRTPDFIPFNEDDRSIQSAYTLDDALIENVPPALENLVGTADLDLSELWHFIQTGDIARRDTAIRQANTRMNAIFKDAWKQSRLSVQFSVDGPQLRVLLWEDGDNITVFDERSAGLRTFVALIAFLKVHGSDRPPVLLIDEAENHLHIDAQADLVNMFVTQEHAVKVIYTTHSPACLPPDLGSGIRTVVPRTDNFQVSDVKNSFWHGSAGFSPLMLAMGAGAAAFTPARCVVLAEGATEMILLPTLIRAATGQSNLPYQVAPGLSEAPKDFYSKLDFEAAKVAYLVDGDSGGSILKKALAKAGVPKRLITTLDVAGIENILSDEAYRAAVTALLPECNPDLSTDKLPELAELPTDVSWSEAVATWCEQYKLQSPSKIAVANWLVENGKAEPSADGSVKLVALHVAMMEIFSLG